MSLTIEDLIPKDFKITVKGVELDCKPVKLSHSLMMASVGSILNNLDTASTESIKKAEKEINTIIPEIIPALKDIELDGPTLMEIITKLGESCIPSDEKFLKENGVAVDPKAEKVG